MWIFDSYFKGCVELWSRERGLKRIMPPILLVLYAPERPSCLLEDDRSPDITSLNLCQYALERFYKAYIWIRIDPVRTVLYRQ